MAKDVIRCMSCDKDITDKIKVYYKGKVTCQECNVSEK